ncbi:acrylyl-CoA reductase family protein [Salimicrobium halophilum]|uniref:Putative quinone oxidoreductase, YhdH/YhfP family n=1 Tax=Salimicrobium halophilum TaxID=86666 RepID=A0A1G8UAD5_9BACI|nr:acryloyl-CoA reductase [Salimicrobium halophilum]SDJ50701.1 putative quinone oxidoreductase, YhdH/YhfP family [Salimicrobium halophilum]
MEEFKALVLEEDKQLHVRSRTIDDLPDGDVTIEVAYSSINYKDAIVGNQNQIVEQYPLVPGIDLSGTVVESKDPSFEKGQEVIVTSYALGTGHDGGYSQYARVPKEWVVPLPDGMTLKEAMILGTAGLTAGLSIKRLEDNSLTPDKGEVLVAGATGGVGSVAVNILSENGYSVTAATGKESEHDYLKKLGASSVIHRDEIMDTDGTPTRKKRWAGAVDPVGGNTLQYILTTLQNGGSVSTSGLVGGIQVSTTVMPFIGRGVNWLGIDSVTCPMPERKATWEKLAGEWKPSLLEDDMLNEVTLEEVPDVLEQILQGNVRGRTIVRLK